MTRRGPGFGRLAASVAALLGVAVLAAASSGPAAAAPVVTQQGTAGHPFTWSALPAGLEVVEGDDGGQDLRLALTARHRIGQGSPICGDATCQARSVEALDGDHLLFADPDRRMVAVVTRAGSEVWSYAADDDGALRTPVYAQRFSRAGRRLTLITDRDARRVWAVDEEKDLVWQYGVTGEPGIGVNHLAGPSFARYSEAEGGTVVIADGDGDRVIEVRYGDYAAGAPDNGFTEQSIVWSYGTPGGAGGGAGRLDDPQSAERLSSGNILVADTGAQRVIEIDRGTRAVVWRYGETDQLSPGAGQLRQPTFARRLSDGDTLIADAGNTRVLRVSQERRIENDWDMNALGRPAWATSTSSAFPRQAVYTPDGLLAVADDGMRQIVLLGYEAKAQAVSTPLDCGQPGVKKAFVSLTWKGDTGQSGTKVSVAYRLGGGAWRACVFKSGTRRFAFPAGAVARTIAYRVTLSSLHPGRTPTLDAISIQSTNAKTGGEGGGGGGAAGGSGNSGQTGTYTYPPVAQGGTGGSGTGTGSGSSGSGTGSGTYGAGTGSSGAGAGSATAAESVDVPVDSTGGGPAQPVQGFEVQGQEGVSGVPLRAAEGAHAADSEQPGAPVPLLALAAAGLVVAAAFFVPWPLMAAHLRRLTGFDHTRPTRFLPFRPLGR
ncbi:MAG: hypothetical protein GX624_12115 [Actinobacteria bacterium]|nr:hypothetical protein [Actinomycetota bacterium]